MAGRSRVEVKGQYIAYLAKSSEEMASQIAATAELHVLEYQSYVRGYHAYVDNWTPVIGQKQQSRCSCCGSVLR